MKVLSFLMCCLQGAALLGMPLQHVLPQETRLQHLPKPIPAFEPSFSPQKPSSIDIPQLPWTFEPTSDVGRKACRPSSSCYQARGPGYDIRLSPKEAVLTLSSGGSLEKPLQRAEIYFKPQGAHQSISVQAEDLQVGTSNYFLGSHAQAWRRGVPHYARIRYSHVYPGIDLVYHGQGHALEYDWIVAPHRDPKRIRFSFEGIDGLTINTQGELVLTLSFGKLVQHKPVIYQEIEGKKRFIKGGYVRLGPRSIGFWVGVYDTHRPLVIDPSLTYSTYLGGNYEDRALAIAQDPQGNRYIAGVSYKYWIYSSPMKATERAFQKEHKGKAGTVFVAKFDPQGQPIYISYLGGDAQEEAYAVAADAEGNAYVTGYTYSPRESSYFPTTPQCTWSRKRNWRLAESDVFITKISSNGENLVYSGLLGGSKDDVAYGIALDQQGQAYVTGYTKSVDFPLEDPIGPSQHGGGSDVFISKISSDGSKVLYSTSIGGKADDIGRGIAVDKHGLVYVTGGTKSLPEDFLRKTGGTSPSYPFALSSKAFILQLKTDGSRPLNTDFLSGSGNEEGRAIAVDSQGYVYATGLTTSVDFPVTEGAYQTRFGGDTDAFVAKWSPSWKRAYVTYLGGSGNDEGRAIAVNDIGSVYVTGATFSEDFPQAGILRIGEGFTNVPPSRQASDVFVTQFDSQGQHVKYSICLGGENTDGSHGIVVDDQGNVHVAGGTLSRGFLATANAYQPWQAGKVNAFMSTLSVHPSGLEMEAPLSASRYGQSVAFIAKIKHGVPTHSHAGLALSHAMVRFKDGDRVLGHAPLGLSRDGSTYEAVFKTDALDMGCHRMSAEFEGNDVWGPSRASGLTPHCVKFSTKIHLQSLEPDAQVGHLIAWVVDIDGQDAEGQVDFIEEDDQGASHVLGSQSASHVLGSQSASHVLGSKTLGRGQKQLTWLTRKLKVGVHRIKAVYHGDPRNFQDTSNTVTQQIMPFPSAVNLSFPKNPVGLHEPVVLRAHVQGFHPTGEVVFKEILKGPGGADVELGRMALDASSKKVSFSTSAVSAGPHWFAATYLGDSNNKGAQSSLMLGYVQKLTPRMVILPAYIARLGQEAEFTVDFEGGQNPTGAVTFKEDDRILGTVFLKDGKGVHKIAFSEVGLHSLVASYQGDDSHIAQDMSILYIVDKDATQVEMKMDSQTVYEDQHLLLTAMVMGVHHHEVPTGHVTFVDGQTPLATRRLHQGRALYETSELKPGKHFLKVLYSGDARHEAMQSPATVQMVQPRDALSGPGQKQTIKRRPSGGCNGYGWGGSPGPWELVLLGLAWARARRRCVFHFSPYL